MKIADRARVDFELDTLAGVAARRRRLPLAAVLTPGRLVVAAVVVAVAVMRPVHVVVHDGVERVLAHFRLSRRRGRLHRSAGLAPVRLVPATGAAAAPRSARRRRSRLQRDRDVVRRVTAAFARPFHNDHLDQRHHRVAYLAHLAGQFELLEQAHVAVALERRVLVAEREQLRHAQRVIVSEQPGQLAVRLRQRLKH